MPDPTPSRISPGSHRIAIVAARFNEFIVDRLLAAAIDTFDSLGGDDANLTVARVPGAFELPVAARRYAETGEYAAVVTLGCVIRGETDHYDHVVEQTAKGIKDAGVLTGIPVAFGVITCDNLEQAIHRTGGKHGNMGRSAMLAALEMANLVGDLPRPGSKASIDLVEDAMPADRRPALRLAIDHDDDDDATEITLDIPPLAHRADDLSHPAPAMTRNPNPTHTVVPTGGPTTTPVSDEPPAPLMTPARQAKRAQRRLAMQALYQLDMARSGDELDLEDLAEQLDTEHDPDDATRRSAAELAGEAWQRRAEADDAVTRLSPDWPSHRQPPVDRAILRLAYHELTTGRVPAAVAINEAVELAKAFGDAPSSKFVNGVLDKLAKSDGVMRAQSLAPTEPPPKQTDDQWLSDAVESPSS